MATEDFELIAITRDLVRKPEVKFLANALCKMATGSVGDEIPPVYVRLAYKIIKPENKKLLIAMLELL